MTQKVLARGANYPCQINTTVTSEQYRFVTSIAKSEGISFAEALRYLIEEARAALAGDEE